MNFQNDSVICGPGENAGVIDIGNGLAAVFKEDGVDDDGTDKTQIGIYTHITKIVHIVTSERNRFTISI